MYIIETGLKTGSFVNIMEIENKHIEDLIYSYLMGDISEEGRNELLQWLETDDAHKQVDAKDALSWMDGSLKFSEQPFMSIAKDLERKFNVRIRVESDLLRKEIFSGSFTKDYSLDKILREVDVDHKYVWTRSGDEIIIKDK